MSCITFTRNSLVFIFFILLSNNVNAEDRFVQTTIHFVIPQTNYSINQGGGGLMLDNWEADCMAQNLVLNMDRTECITMEEYCAHIHMYASNDNLTCINPIVGQDPKKVLKYSGAALGGIVLFGIWYFSRDKDIIQTNIGGE